MKSENEQSIHLNPVIFVHNCFHEMPLTEGNYVCEIFVKNGSVSFQHKAYELFNGCWDALPDENELAEKIFQEGEKCTLRIQCSEHYGQKDMLLLSNQSWTHGADLQYSYKKI